MSPLSLSTCRRTRFVVICLVRLTQTHTTLRAARPNLISIIKQYVRRAKITLHALLLLRPDARAVIKRAAYKTDAVSNPETSKTFARLFYGTLKHFKRLSRAKHAQLFSLCSLAFQSTAFSSRLQM